MAFATCVVKYECKCKRCGCIMRVGEKMRYGGPGRTYHIKRDCPATETTNSTTDLHPQLTHAKMSLEAYLDGCPD